ncbi:MAG TPA: hypothetical protein VGE11_08500 [Pseudonocardia sp.]
MTKAEDPARTVERAIARHPGEPRRGDRGENRIPPAVAVIVAAALYALLPDPVRLGPRVIVAGIEAVLLVSLLITNPRRMTRETRASRVVSLLLAALVAVTNLVALGLLVADLVSGRAAQAQSLLLAGLQVWLTGVIGFGLIYWELDRGGPVSRASRTRSALPAADWRFSQDENDDTVVEVAKSASGKAGWVPEFVDYLYLSLTNSSAFSPTDTMPLTTRAKLLMGVQAMAALLVTLVIVARAVGAIQQ